MMNISKIDEAQIILKELGLPPSQQNRMSALTLLALCGISENDNWDDSRIQSLGVTKGIMSFMTEHYDRLYAPNTRETVRRQVLHQFVQARIADYNPDNPHLPVNSPNAHYAISEPALRAIRTFGTKEWGGAVEIFKSEEGELKKKYAKEKEQNLIPVTLSDGTRLKLSAGKHSEVQVAIIEKFAPRFAKGAVVLYFGDTANKDLYKDDTTLSNIGIPIDSHNKLPDVIIYDSKRDLLYLIEVVTSHGPVSPKRQIEFEQMLSNCKAKRIYISAFPDYAEFKKYLTSIAWETEVWLSEIPDHLIHFNGDKFLSK